MNSGWIWPPLVTGFVTSSVACERRGVRGLAPHFAPHSSACFVAGSVTHLVIHLVTPLVNQIQQRVDLTPFSDWCCDSFSGLRLTSIRCVLHTLLRGTQMQGMEISHLSTRTCKQGAIRRGVHSTFCARLPRLHAPLTWNDGGRSPGNGCVPWEWISAFEMTFGMASGNELCSTLMCSGCAALRLNRAGVMAALCVLFQSSILHVFFIAPFPLLPKNAEFQS